MRIPLMLLTFVLVLSSVTAVEFVAKESAINASLLYYQPVPAQPGDQLDIWIQIQNHGGSSTRPGTITFIGNNVFVLENERDRVKFFPQIPGQQNFLVTTKVRVSKDATEGVNNLVIRIQEEGKASTIERQLPIQIIGSKSTIAIVSAITTPNQIAPGETAHMELVVQNVGSTQVRNVDVTLDFSNLQLAPYGSSNSQTLGILPRGAAHSFAFDIVSYPSAESQAYQIPITVKYDDEQGNEKSQNETIGIVVGSAPELLVYFDTVQITEDTLEGDVVLRFVNRGLAEVKLLQAEIVEGDGIEVISESPVVYIGNIDEDDYESTDLTLRVAAGTTSVPVRVEYKDALNRQYTEDISVPLRIQPPAANGGLGMWVWLLIIAAIVVGVFLYRRRRRK